MVSFSDIKLKSSGNTFNMCLSKGSSLYSLSSRIKLSNTAYSNYRLEVVARVLVLTLKNFSGSIGNLRMKLKTFYLKTGKSELKI